MSANKRLEDLTAYKGVLPYASELFGVYQPLIGWKSKRTRDWINNNGSNVSTELLLKLIPYFESRDKVSFNEDCAISPDQLRPAGFRAQGLAGQRWIVLQEISKNIDAFRNESARLPQKIEDWRKIINEQSLSTALKTVLSFYQDQSINYCRIMRSSRGQAVDSQASNETMAEQNSQRIIRFEIDQETAAAGLLQKLVEFGAVEHLSRLFIVLGDSNSADVFKNSLESSPSEFNDPFLTFDPAKKVTGVAVSPLGIVHLFRQFFFELDTFLGTPVGHVWLSPGSTVELIETSTRKTIVEKTTEVSTETINKSEKATTDQDDISTAIKQDNKDDLKLGITATVNQSWGTGNASATASLNMDKTQQTAREHTEKRMRQQSEKVSTEMKESYKTTLRTVTESTDVNSKRYVIANTGTDLLNYEFRRKMRQVGVQVQDIGSYLCWETFVDEPGSDLGLANLVHLAKPADLTPPPDPTRKQYPPNQHIAIKVNAAWVSDDIWFYNWRTITNVSLKDIGVPEGFEIVPNSNNAPGSVFPLAQISASGEDFVGPWGFGGKFTNNTYQTFDVGVVIINGLNWRKRVDFVIGGTVEVRATQATKDAIDAANAKVTAVTTAVDIENEEKKKVAVITAITNRIELVRDIKKRSSDDLREEERIIIYRRLVESLMTSNQYHYADNKARHVLSALINTIFDIDKMLYFVAPEWWKPRAHSKISIGVNNITQNLQGSIVTWDSQQNRKDDYLITGKSTAAPMGASLGWLLQLDGDNLRNAFLNAPWVKSVIPIRPGREKAALAWLQGAKVEGVEGLDFEYAAADQAELDGINQKLGRPVGTKVTILDALEYLCETVAEKDTESRGVKLYPMTEINDDNKVSSTPIEKVYEHGFYPLQGGFRAQPNDPNPDPNNKDKNFQVFEQWVEVVPTDQIVPVKVDYDPRTGRQK